MAVFITMLCAVPVNVQLKTTEGLTMFNSKKSMTEMSSKRFKKSLLAVSIMALGVPSFAQTASGSNEEVMEEVVVTGMRNSIESAQELKRSADTVKDVITASDIGALPDKSVTEALQRVPGVTIERFASSNDPNHFADEGTGVLVRGLDRVRSEINGRDSFSANPWGGLNFEDISPELLGAVEVVKNQTSDLIAGGIAGTVNLITRKPFDADGRVIGVTVKGNYADFRDEWTPSVSGLFSDRWETSAGEFGFLLSASQSEYKTRGDGIGVANYYSRGDAYGGITDQWGTPAGADPDSEVEGSQLSGQAPDTVLYMPGQFSIRTADNDREREGIASSLQWKNNDDTVQATAEYIRSDATLTYRERVIGTQGQGFDWATKTGIDVVLPSEVAGYPEPVFDANDFFVSGVVDTNNNVLPMLSSTRFNETENVVEDLSFNLLLKPTDKLTVELDYQHIDSTQTVVNNGINARTLHRAAGWTDPTVDQRTTDAYLDLSGKYPTVEFLNDAFFDAEGVTVHNWDGPRNSLFLTSGLDQNVDSDAKADSFKIDLGYDVDNGVVTTIKTGIYYSDKDLTIRDTEYSNWGFLATAWDTAAINAASYTNNPDEFEVVNFNDFFGGGQLNGRTDFLFPTMSNAENFTDFARRGCAEGFLMSPYAGGSSSSPSQNDPSCYLAQADLGDRVDGTVYAPHHITSSNEERVEAYVRADFETDELSLPIKGNVGLRYVNYQLASTGFLVFPAPVKSEGGGSDLFAQMYPSLSAFANNEGEEQSVDGTDYTSFLPSFNLAVSVTDDVVVRFGASQGLYFPTLDQTRNSRILALSYRAITQDPTQSASPSNPVVDFSNVQLNGNARNPYLEPEESTNFDLTTEWYFSKSGSLTGALFYKKIDNLFRERQFFDDVTNTSAGVTETVSFVGPFNDGSGTIKGVELAYTQFFDMLPGAWSGLGVQMNYTYIDQNDLDDPQADAGQGGIRLDSSGNVLADDRNSFRAFGNLPLPGYSDENYNIVGMYEYADISARIAYTWRSDYLITRRDSNEFAPIYSTDAGYLDASIYYTINDNIKIGIEGSNLLDTITTTQAQFNEAGMRTDSLNFKTDKRYALSLRATF